MAADNDSGVNIPPGCGLWFGWFLSSLFGMALGWALGWYLSFGVPGALSTVALGLTTGVVLGTMQWLVLRVQMKGAAWWIVATGAGWAAGFSLGVFAASLLSLSGTAFGLLVGAVVGIFLGLFQWAALFKQVNQAYWWIPASLIAWVSSMLYYQPGASGMGILYGALSGIVTGTLLLWLLYRPVAEEPPTA